MSSHDQSRPNFIIPNSGFLQVVGPQLSETPKSLLSSPRRPCPPDVTDVEILGTVFPDCPVEFCLFRRLDMGVERVNDRLQEPHFTGVVV